jgi:hypothetical protein
MNIEFEDYNGNTILVVNFPKVTQDDIDSFKDAVLDTLHNTDFSFADMDNDEITNDVYIRLQCDETENETKLLCNLITKLLTTLDKHHF